MMKIDLDTHEVIRLLQLLAETVGRLEAYKRDDVENPKLWDDLIAPNMELARKLDASAGSPSVFDHYLNEQRRIKRTA